MQKITSPLQSALWQSLQNHPNVDIIVAYSGGVDSQVLLHALVQLKSQQFIQNNITVCHVNHGLSDNSLSWQNFAEQECKNYAVKLVTKAVNVKAAAQQSLEALARDARYLALKSINDNKSIILTGHHSDDQSETFLLALKRGAGLKGLSSMKLESPLAQHVLMRPLLNISRLEIVNYANDYRLKWIEDESNTDTRFDRNFIRQIIMPLLRERWPAINQTINRSAEHCHEGQRVLDEVAEQDLSASKVDDTILNIELLSSHSVARFNNLIRYFLTLHNCVMPTTAQLTQLREQLNVSNDKTPEVKLGERIFRRYKKQLHLTPEYDDVSHWSFKLPYKKVLKEGNVKLQLPDQLGQLSFFTSEFNMKGDKNISHHFYLPKDSQSLTIRFNHSNPTCLPSYRQHSRKLKKVLQELTIPTWERKRIPFLYCDDELVAAIGYFICQPFLINSNEEKLGFTWHR